MQIYIINLTIKKSALNYYFGTQYLNSLFSGLLLPRVGVEHHGIERTDIGNLGSGIYFSDDVRLVKNLKVTTVIPENCQFVLAYNNILD